MTTHSATDAADGGLLEGLCAELERLHAESVVHEQLTAAIRRAVECKEPKLLRLSLARRDWAQRNAALWCAAQMGATHCAQEILSIADAKAVDERGRTALIAAAEAGHLDCVQLLLPHSDAKHVDGRGLDALMHAADSGHADVVEALLPVSNPRATVAAGPRGDFTEEGSTALFFAARAGRDRCVELLLPHSDPKTARADGSTVLMEAAAMCRAKTVRLLLPLSDPNAQADDGTTALMAAVERGGRNGSIRSLRRVSDGLLRDRSGADALHYAVDRELQTLDDDFGSGYAPDGHLAHMLLPKSATRKGLSPALAASIDRAMRRAVSGGAVGTARVLLPFCAPLRRDADGWTLLMHAAARFSPELVRLLSPVSDGQAVNDRGHSALEMALDFEGFHYGDAATVDECAELLAPVSLPEHAAKAFKKLGRERMPRWAAELEARALREAMQGSADGALPAEAATRTRASHRL